MFKKESIFGRYPIASGALLLLLGASLAIFDYYVLFGPYSVIWWMTIIAYATIIPAIIIAIIGLGVAIFLSEDQAPDVLSSMI